MGNGSSAVDYWVHRAIFLGASLLCVACSVGEGQGEISGSARSVACDLDQPAYELAPSFFTGEVTADFLNIRIQRGSDLESRADGLMIFVSDVNDIFDNRIGLPIAIGREPDAPVRTVFFLNETCPVGIPNDPRTQPTLFDAESGEIVFNAIYAPDRAAGATLIEAELTGLTLSGASPDDSASLDGWFSFFVQRGSPAQRFP